MFDERVLKAKLEKIGFATGENTGYGRCEAIHRELMICWNGDTYEDIFSQMLENQRMLQRRGEHFSKLVSDLDFLRKEH